MISLFSIFLVFIKIGLMTFGGAYASIAIIEREIVNNLGWLSYREFSDLLAIDEITPGPIMLNCASFIGMRVHGPSGCIVASIGCMLPSIIISLLLIFIYTHYKKVKAINDILTSLKSMALALILSTLLTFILNTILIDGIITNINFISLLLVIIGFILLRKLKLNPILIILACGLINLTFTFI